MKTLLYIVDDKHLNRLLCTVQNLSNVTSMASGCLLLNSDKSNLILLFITLYVHSTLSSVLCERTRNVVAELEH